MTTASWHFKGPGTCCVLTRTCAVFLCHWGCSLTSGSFLLRCCFLALRRFKASFGLDEHGRTSVHDWKMEQRYYFWSHMDHSAHSWCPAPLLCQWIAMLDASASTEADLLKGLGSWWNSLNDCWSLWGTSWGILGWRASCRADTYSSFYWPITRYNWCERYVAYRMARL